MTEQICPVCGCSIGDEAYEKDGLKYCCEPCADQVGQCGCGCCLLVENKDKK